MFSFVLAYFYARTHCIQQDAFVQPIKAFFSFYAAIQSIAHKKESRYLERALKKSPFNEEKKLENYYM
ncbi:hypothetical protein GCM10020331_057510 [Ectobacillus funiculus]